LKPGFEYLEDRILGRCQAPYSCAAEFELFRLVQLFDPTFARQGATTASVRSLAAIKPLSGEDELLAQMCTELPAYLAAAADVHVNRADVADFTDAVLAFWRDYAEQLPGWALAARIVFAISCNSASCERVFSLLKRKFGTEQLSALSDYVGGSLMLSYNERELG
jgi:hypothetical protein